MTIEPKPAAQRSRLRRFLNRWEVDRAVFFVLMTRGWQLAAGVVSMLVYATAFSGAELGLYGMFATLMGLNLLVELGLAVVAAAIASHEWARLEIAADGIIRGDEQALARLAGLLQQLGPWYLRLAVGFTIIVGIAGYLFLARRASSAIDWEAPWFALVLISGPSIYWWGRIAILEGCDQLRVVHQVRFWQSVAGNLIVWPAMLAGAGLWAAALGAAIRLLFDFWLMRVRYARFFASLAPKLKQSAISWREEVWPLQWRIAIRSIAGWVALQLFAPVLYEYHGEALTGRFWLTWTGLCAIEGAAFAWVQMRAPLFGMLVARRDFTELDRVFRRLTAISCGVLALGGAAAAGGIAVLPSIPLHIAPKLAERLLPPETVAVFVLGMLVYNVVRCLGLYVQAHKRDPFLRAHLLACAVTGCAVWWGGRHYGAWGEAVGYLAAMAGVFLPLWIGFYRRCRNEWQSPVGTVGNDAP